QQRAVGAVGQTLIPAVPAWQSKKRRRTRLPSPHTVTRADPKVPVAILVDAERAGAGAAVFSVTRDPTILDSAERPMIEIPRRPDRAAAILEKLVDIASGERLVVQQPSIFPAGEALICTDPKRSVARGEQTENVIGRKTLIAGGL